MDITLSASQVATRELFGELFGAEMVADLRRMGNRELGAGAVAPLDPAEAGARDTVWQALCDLGGLRLALPTERGGSDAGVSGQVALAQLIGTSLYQSPWADTLIAIEIAAACGSDDLVAGMARGQAVAIAVRDRAGAEPDQPGALDLGRVPGRLSAVRSLVAFAPDVSSFLVAGTADGETRLFLLPAGHPGISWQRHDDIGRGDLYRLTFQDVPLADTTDLTGADGAVTWRSALTSARIRQAAYLVGLTQAALDETVSYARQRRQFGQPIGRFQAVAFRLADAATRTEATRLLVQLAAWQADENQDARLAALQALCAAADLARLVCTEAVQLHGAVGMTEEHDAQLFYRRAAVDTLWLGRPTELRRQAASLLAARYR